MNYTYLTSGVIMISVSPFVIYKVYRGSKSNFAYILMAFTLLSGAQNFSSFFISKFRHPVYVDDQKYNIANFYANQTVNYCFYLVSLQ